MAAAIGASTFVLLRPRLEETVGPASAILAAAWTKVSSKEPPLLALLAFLLLSRRRRQRNRTQAQSQAHRHGKALLLSDRMGSRWYGLQGISVSPVAEEPQGPAETTLMLDCGHRLSLVTANMTAKASGGEMAGEMLGPAVTWRPFRLRVHNKSASPDDIGHHDHSLATTRVLAARQCQWYGSRTRIALALLLARWKSAGSLRRAGPSEGWWDTREEIGQPARLQESNNRFVDVFACGR